jgi:hypothetical protein
LIYETNGTTKRMFCNAFKLRAIDQLWFHAKPIRGPKHEVQFRDRPDSNDTAWLITSAEEKLTLIATGDFHGFPFVEF